MNPLVPWIWAAGVIHLVIVAANLALPRKLEYRANLVRVSPIVRQVFITHSAYIVLNLLACSALCLFFAPELAGGSRLGAFMSAYMAGFWWLRLCSSRFSTSTRRPGGGIPLPTSPLPSPSPIWAASQRWQVSAL